MCSKGRVRRRAEGAKPDQKSEVPPCPLHFVATDPGPAGRFLPENTNLLELQPLGQGLTLLSPLRSPRALLQLNLGQDVWLIKYELSWGKRGHSRGGINSRINSPAAGQDPKPWSCRTTSQTLELHHLKLLSFPLSPVPWTAVTLTALFISC